MIFKPILQKESEKNILRDRLLGPNPQSVCYSMSGMGPANSDFSKLPGIAHGAGPETAGWDSMLEVLTTQSAMLRLASLASPRSFWDTIILGHILEFLNQNLYLSKRDDISSMGNNYTSNKIHITRILFQILFLKMYKSPFVERKRKFEQFNPFFLFRQKNMVFKLTSW